MSWPRSPPTPGDFVGARALAHTRREQVPVQPTPSDDDDEEQPGSSDDEDEEEEPWCEWWCRNRSVAREDYDKPDGSPHAGAETWLSRSTPRRTLRPSWPHFTPARWSGLRPRRSGLCTSANHVPPRPSGLAESALVARPLPCRSRRPRTSARCAAPSSRRAGRPLPERCPPAGDSDDPWPRHRTRRPIPSTKWRG